MAVSLNPETKNTSFVDAESLQADSKNTVSPTDRPSTSSSPIIFFIGMWMVFAVIGCWMGISSDVPIIISVLAGIVGGFVMSFVTTLLSPFGAIPIR